MGIVVQATHMHLGTPVALKFLLAEMAQSQQMAERFMREARASAQLKSEHVCRVSDVGMLDNGAPYIVMELLSGQDLSSILRTHGPLGIGVAADYVLQACIALAEAHAAGIVHRDLKPGNLFWTQRPDGSTLIKVLDFGIAKATSPGSQNFSMTQTSAVMGSPGYMSPEQLKSSRDVDARSDIWSLGCVLYELLTGRAPFHGESITELALRVAMDPTPQLPPSFPRPFEGVIGRCLEKDPARRYQDVAELAMALAPFAGPRGVEMANGVTRVLRGVNAVPVTPSTNPHHGPGTSPHGRAVTTPTTLGTATGQVGEPPRRRGGLIAMIAGGAVVAGIVAIAVTMGSKGDPADKTVEPAAAPASAVPAVPAPPAPTPTPTPTEIAPTPTEVPPTPAPAAAGADVEPADTKPAATASTAATDPDTTTPAATTKPADATPADTKPAATEPAATKPADTKPATKKPAKKKPKKRPEDIGDSRI